MQKAEQIDSRSKSVRDLLSAKYTIDYYQREYKWETRHITELLDDLEAKFFANYDEKHERTAVQYYAHYFLGSIVISRKEGENYIIDGQQRLTSLTLLLIYLHNLQQDRLDQIEDIRVLIFSERYGRKSFNLNVPERTACLEALYTGQPFDATDQSESARNIVARYEDLEENFPDTLKDKALPFFIDWLLDNVDLVQITAYSDDDAYTVFETMNDRGLSLSPTDMLKGYLLANINDPDQKATANNLWKQRMLELVALGTEGVSREEEADFFKAWLRAKYAESIRERKKGATNRDFERIGTTFHKWVREEQARIGLHASTDFWNFVQRDFMFFSKQYVRLRQAAVRLIPGLEYVYYNAYNNFTLQYPLILAPLRPDDGSSTIDHKIRLVATYIDIFIALRVWNFQTLSYSSISYTMFNVLKDIRDKSVAELATILTEKVAEIGKTFQSKEPFRLHQQNARHVHYLLARITRHIEEESGVASSFVDYVSRGSGKPFEIEHIWANKYERHGDEFNHQIDFEAYRNRIGGLLLLPRGFNQSLGDDTYQTKVGAYFGQNLLAKSLNEQCYKNNPSFLAYVQRSGLSFRPHPQFKQVDLDARQDLYRRICDEIWSPARLA